MHSSRVLTAHPPVGAEGSRSASPTGSNTSEGSDGMTTVSPKCYSSPEVFIVSVLLIFSALGGFTLTTAIGGESPAMVDRVAPPIATAGVMNISYQTLRPFLKWCCCSDRSRTLRKEYLNREKMIDFLFILLGAAVAFIISQQLRAEKNPSMMMHGTVSAAGAGLSCGVLQLVRAVMRAFCKKKNVGESIQDSVEGVEYHRNPLHDQGRDDAQSGSGNLHRSALSPAPRETLSTISASATGSVYEDPADIRVMPAAAASGDPTPMSGGGSPNLRHRAGPPSVEPGVPIEAMVFASPTHGRSPGGSPVATFSPQRGRRSGRGGHSSRSLAPA